MYQGHHQDGSSIQRHSAGTHYPYIVGMQEHPGGRWFVMAPSGNVLIRDNSAAAAFEWADEFAKERRYRDGRKS